MEKKNLLTLNDDFLKYCELNNITEIDKFAKEVFEKGFMFFKYGTKPNVINDTLENKEKKIDIKKDIKKIPNTNNLYDE